MNRTYVNNKISPHNISNVLDSITIVGHEVVKLKLWDVADIPLNMTTM